jgi:hypothetical protein
MSQATRQTIALLALTASALAHIKATPETEHTLEYAWEVTGQAIEDFPRSKNDARERLWVKARLNEWNESSAAMVSWSPFSLASIAFEIVEDMLGVIRDRRKREVLEPLHEALQALCGSYVDGDKEEAEHYREARAMVADMYRVIGFLGGDG